MNCREDLLIANLVAVDQHTKKEEFSKVFNKAVFHGTLSVLDLG